MNTFTSLIENISSWVFINLNYLGFSFSLIGTTLSIILLWRVSNIKKAEKEERGKLIRSLDIPNQMDILIKSINIIQSIDLTGSSNSYNIELLKSNLIQFQTMLNSSIKALQPYLNDEQFEKLLSEFEQSKINEISTHDYRIIKWNQFMSEANEYIRGNNEVKINIFAHSAKGFLEGLKDTIIKEAELGHIDKIRILTRSDSVEGEYIKLNQKMLALGTQYINQMESKVKRKVNFEDRYFIGPPPKLRFVKLDGNLFLSFYTFIENDNDQDIEYDIRLTGRGIDTLALTKETTIGMYFHKLCSNIFDYMWKYRSFSKEEVKSLLNSSDLQKIMLKHINTKL